MSSSSSRSSTARPAFGSPDRPTMVSSSITAPPSSGKKKGKRAASPAPLPPPPLVAAAGTDGIPASSDGNKRAKPERPKPQSESKLSGRFTTSPLRLDDPKVTTAQLIDLLHDYMAESNDYKLMIGDEETTKRLLAKNDGTVTISSDEAKWLRAFLIELKQVPVFHRCVIEQKPAEHTTIKAAVRDFLSGACDRELIEFFYDQRQHALDNSIITVAPLDVGAWVSELQVTTATIGNWRRDGIPSIHKTEAVRANLLKNADNIVNLLLRLPRTSSSSSVVPIPRDATGAPAAATSLGPVSPVTPPPDFNAQAVSHAVIQEQLMTNLRALFQEVSSDDELPVARCALAKGVSVQEMHDDMMKIFNKCEVHAITHCWRQKNDSSIADYRQVFAWRLGLKDYKELTDVSKTDVSAKKGMIKTQLRICHEPLICELLSDHMRCCRPSHLKLGNTAHNGRDRNDQLEESARIIALAPLIQARVNALKDKERTAYENIASQFATAVSKLPVTQQSDPPITTTDSKEERRPLFRSSSSSFLFSEQAQQVNNDTSNGPFVLSRFPRPGLVADSEMEEKVNGARRDHPLSMVNGAPIPNSTDVSSSSASSSSSVAPPPTNGSTK